MNNIIIFSKATVKFFINTDTNEIFIILTFLLKSIDVTNKCQCGTFDNITEFQIFSNPVGAFSMH